MAEGARLESVYTGNRIEGSNPSLSASPSATNFLRPVFGALKTPITAGIRAQNLRTALTPSEPEILSLGPFVSKPPHFADLVRFS